MYRISASMSIPLDLEDFAGRPAFRYTRYGFPVGAESGPDPPATRAPIGIERFPPLGD
jgi:hypothetical protein